MAISLALGLAVSRLLNHAIEQKRAAAVGDQKLAMFLILENFANQANALQTNYTVTVTQR